MLMLCAPAKTGRHPVTRRLEAPTRQAAPAMKKAVHRARLAVTAQRLAAYLWLMRRTIQSPKLWMACTKKISRITTASMMSGRKRW